MRPHIHVVIVTRPFTAPDQHRSIVPRHVSSPSSEHHGLNLRNTSTAITMPSITSNTIVIARHTSSSTRSSMSSSLAPELSATLSVSFGAEFLNKRLLVP
jgi:hypothetical protein